MGAAASTSNNSAETVGLDTFSTSFGRPLGIAVQAAAEAVADCLWRRADKQVLVGQNRQRGELEDVKRRVFYRHRPKASIPACGCSMRQADNDLSA
jgi:hypothetical protein